jgi:peptidoglycan-N-acetylglucosamine deacetylase
MRAYAVFASLALLALVRPGLAAPAETNGWTFNSSIAVNCDAPTRYARLLFPGGRKKALTLSFDDGRIMDRRLVKILNVHGVRATFNLISSVLDKEGYVTRQEVKDLYKGHEVACHTVTHPPLSKQTDEVITREIMENRKDLESLVGYPVRGLAYPGGDCDQRVARFLPRLGIAYARTVGATTWMALPENPLLWAATCHHGNCVKDGERLLSWPTSPALLYVWGHSYEFEDARNWNLIEEFARKMGGHDEIWYATNIEIVDYLAAARGLIISADGRLIENGRALSVWIEYQGRAVQLEPGKVTHL